MKLKTKIVWLLTICTMACLSVGCGNQNEAGRNTPTGDQPPASENTIESLTIEIRTQGIPSIEIISVDSSSRLAIQGKAIVESVLPQIADTINVTNISPSSITPQSQNLSFSFKFIQTQANRLDYQFTCPPTNDGTTNSCNDYLESIRQQGFSLKYENIRSSSGTLFKNVEINVRMITA